MACNLLRCNLKLQYFIVSNRYLSVKLNQYFLFISNYDEELLYTSYDEFIVC